ncbi:signal peptidase II [Bordetella genomosp. 9]|uniref:Lipoprotein signal peptidase n=1 Tax=Bordetella genomosp. 9 TaxID=1416803 RepID=A0A1W6YYU4_9BORD|nr:signal peptidase II [Bordetella genomosp. 9]ARP86248.1 signal peptidase II [Bordetella genomosp. 9]
MLEAQQPAAAPDAASQPRYRRGLTFWLLLAAAIIVLDQASKLYFNANFSYGQRLNVLPVFDLTLVYNRGAAFSFLASEPGWQRWFFTVLGVGAAVVIAVILARQGKRAAPRFALALAMIMGGALGNVIDRIAYGHVVDFLLFYWKDWYYPAFNVADVAITCGAILLILDELLRMRRTTPSGA